MDLESRFACGAGQRSLVSRLKSSKRQQVGILGREYRGWTNSDAKPARWSSFERPPFYAMPTWPCLLNTQAVQSVTRGPKFGKVLVTGRIGAHSECEARQQMKRP